MTDPLHATLAGLLPAQLTGIDAALKAGFKGQTGFPGRSLLKAEMDRGIRESLAGIDLYAQLAAAFVWAQNLRARRTDTDDAPARTPLGAQQVSLGASPVLSVSVNGFALPPLRVTYDVTASFDGVDLETLRGGLIALLPGECQIAARLSCGKVDLYKPQPFFKYQLPVRIDLHPVLPIP